MSTVIESIPHTLNRCPFEPLSYFYLPLLPAPRSMPRLAQPAPVLALPSRGSCNLAEQRAEQELYRHLISLSKGPGQITQRPGVPVWEVGADLAWLAKSHIILDTNEVVIKHARPVQEWHYPVTLSEADLHQLIHQAARAYHQHELIEFKVDLNAQLNQVHSPVEVQHGFYETHISKRDIDGAWVPVLTILVQRGELKLHEYVDSSLLARGYAPAWLKKYDVPITLTALETLVDELVAQHNARVDPTSDAAVSNWVEAQRFEDDLRRRLAVMGKVNAMCSYGDHNLLDLSQPGLSPIAIAESHGGDTVMCEFIPAHQRFKRQPSWRETYHFYARAPFWMKTRLKALVHEHNAALASPAAVGGSHAL